MNLHSAYGIDAYTSKENRENNHTLGIVKMTEIKDILMSDAVLSAALQRLPLHSNRSTEDSTNTADLAGVLETLEKIRQVLLHRAHNSHTQPRKDTVTASTASPSEASGGKIERDTVNSATTASTFHNTSLSPLDSQAATSAEIKTVIKTEIETGIETAIEIETVRKQHDYSCEFGLIETASLVYVLRSYHRGLPLPLHWVGSFGLQQCLLLVSQGETK